MGWYKDRVSVAEPQRASTLGRGQFEGYRKEQRRREDPHRSRVSGAPRREQPGKAQEGLREGLRIWMVRWPSTYKASPKPLCGRMLDAACPKACEGVETVQGSGMLHLGS